MDNKTWQQSNLEASTGSGRHLEVAQLQRKVIGSTGGNNVYPVAGTASTVPSHTATHWLQINRFNATNETATSHSHLLSHQHQSQQTQQNLQLIQQQQQQQTKQLRYFQVQKIGSNSYATQTPTSSSVQDHQVQHCNPTHQQPFARHYTFFTSPSSLSPIPVSEAESTSASAATPTSHNSKIPDRTRKNRRETIPYTTCSFTNPFESINESSAISRQALTLKSLEEEQFNRHHHRNLDPNLNNYILCNQGVNRQNCSITSPIYHPQRYRVYANGHTVIPGTGQVSLTTCLAFASTNLKGNNDSIETALYASTSSSSLIAQVPLLTSGIIPAYRKPSLPRFANAFEAVPDMMRDVRPGTTSMTVTSTLTSILVGHEDHFYPTSKSEFNSERLETVGQSIDNLRDKNWPELSLRNRNRVASSILNNREHKSLASVSATTVFKDKVRKKRSVSESKLCNSTLRQLEEQKNSSTIVKSYADVVQKTGNRDNNYLPTSGRINDTRKIGGSDTTILRMKMEDGRGTNERFLQPSATSTPVRRNDLLRIAKKKREHEESGGEDNDHSSTSVSSNGTNNDFSRSAPEVLSSPEARSLINWNENSSSSSLHEMDEDREIPEENTGRRRNSPSRKKLCKMAEMFCFGQLENAAFFRAFDEYNRCRRRMSYTQKLDDNPEVSPPHHNNRHFHQTLADGSAFHGEVTLVAAALSFDRNNMLENDWASDYSPGLQSFVCATNLPQDRLINDSTATSQFRFNAFEEQGAFKILQKLKECADGTGALYTNSWRPEELHFLRRCYQAKNIL